MPGPLLDTLKGVRQDVAPVWLMRQAGRYLPEYRELRAEKGGFLELVYDSEAAAEITVQPIRAFMASKSLFSRNRVISSSAAKTSAEEKTGVGGQCNCTRSSRSTPRFCSERSMNPSSAAPV